MFFLVLISLYTSRVVLNTLGVEDFGIYNVIGGFVALLGIANGSLNVAVSRFLNIEMGRGHNENLSRVFSSSVSIHLILALLLIVIAEAIGPWFITHKMTIPENRLDSAIWVFHCAVFTFAINLISIPYNACIIAHENMKVYAYVSILEAILKLVIVYFLVVLAHDKLKLYGLLLMIVALVIRITYQLYCRRYYAESHFNWIFDKEMVKKMFGFISWNLMGSTSVILADHGVNILINIFCGPIANAARGIATQVNSAVGQFSNNFLTAINPQITKRYGAGEMNNYRNLMFQGSKFSVVLLSMLSLPIFLNTEAILQFWLKIVPEHSVCFVRLILLFTISEAFSKTFTTGLIATGNIKKLMIYVAGARLLNFPLSYLSLYVWGIPELTYCIAIVLSQICLLLRLYLLKKYIDLDMVSYYFKVVLKMSFLIFLSYAIVYCVMNGINEKSILNIAVESILVEIILVFLVYNIGCNIQERKYVKVIIQKVINKYVH